MSDEMAVDAIERGEHRRSVIGWVTLATFIIIILLGGVTAKVSTNHYRVTGQKVVTGRLVEDPRPQIDGFGRGYAVARVAFPTIAGDPQPVLDVSAHAQKGAPIQAVVDTENNQISLTAFGHTKLPNKLVWPMMWPTLGFVFVFLVLAISYIVMWFKYPTEEDPWGASE